MQRERAFDLLRGLCIVSMACAHLAPDSVLERTTHAPVWVDGSVGFVFISGLVLSLVHRRTVDRAGLGAAMRRVVRRIRLIYLANVAVVLFALAIGSWIPAHTEMPGVDRNSWGMTLLRVALVALNPPYSVLGLYVFLMLGALGALALLARGRTALLLSLSVLAYAGVRIAHLDTSLPGHGRNVEFHLGGWQLLFVLGMVLGWHWRDWRLESRLLQRKVQLPAVAVVVTLSGLAHVDRRGLLGAAAKARLGTAFDKVTLAPGVLFFALAILAVGYGAATWIGHSGAGWWFAPLETVGRHSLGSYVIVTFAAMGCPALLRYPGSGLFAQLLAIGALVAAWSWARAREQLGACRRPHGAHRRAPWRSGETWVVDPAPRAVGLVTASPPRHEG